MARLVLGVVGAVVGTYIGIGPQAGFAIGSALGGALEPKPKQEGPRITDLKVQDSSYGTVIPSVYGTYRLSPTVIWADDIIEHEETTEQGGKGGGVEMTTYSYTCSFAIGICEGKIDGIRRIWADGKLYYDTGSLSKFQAGGMTVYYGDETQMPDPTMEAVIGAGLTPAHRGMAYIVFTDLELQKFGNRIPQLSVEVVRGGPNYQAEPPTYLGPIEHTPSFVGVTAEIDRKTGWIYTLGHDDWSSNSVTLTVTSDNPAVGTVATLNIKKLSATLAIAMTVSDGMVLVVFDRFPNTKYGRMPWIQRISAGEAHADGSVKTPPGLLDLQLYGTPDTYQKKRLDPLTNTYKVYDISPIEVELIDMGDYYTLAPFTGAPPGEQWVFVGSAGPIDPVSAKYIGGKIWISYSFTNATYNHYARFNTPSSYVLKETTLLPGSPEVIVGGTDYVGFCCFGGPMDYDFVCINQKTMVAKTYEFAPGSSGYSGRVIYDEKRRKFVSAISDQIITLNPETDEITTYTPTLPEQDNEIEGRPGGSYLTISYSTTLDRYIVGANADGLGSDGLYGYTTLYVVHPETLTIERYFMYEKGDLMIRPLLEARVDTMGRVYMISFDEDNVKRMYLGTMDGVMPLWKIVREISEKCGMDDSQINVSALQDEVMGYGITSVMNGRAAIEPLTIAFMFDAVDSDGKVKFVKRGQAPVLSIDSAETLQDDDQ